MKTNEEILDFFGVEVGKKYKITDQSVKRLYDWTGRTFVVVINHGYLEIQFDQVPKKQDINMLVDYVYEEVKEILTDKEKEYLQAVIKPFRDKVRVVSKQTDALFEQEYIKIHLCHGDCCTLPFFEQNQMYKGMEANKHYKLEELGL